MLPEDIINILNKYDDLIAEEISAINLAITRISDALSTVNTILISELSSFATHTGMQNVDKEQQLYNDSLLVREYVSSIHMVDSVPENERVECTDDNKDNTLDIFDIIVLSNTMKCSSKGHETNDVTIQIPIAEKDGSVNYQTILASFCKQCKRYTILKSDFKKIEGVILCEVIDETNPYNNDTTDEFIVEQRESLLYKYGYNVQSKINLSSKQRHIILASVIEANILTRRQIIDHLSTLIERGSKIPNWKDATLKWKEDRYYVQSYKTENLPKAIFDKIILKYSYQH